MKSTPYCIPKSSTVMISPTMTEITTTATDCFIRSSLSGQVIFLNSVFTPFQNFTSLDAFSDFAESPMLILHSHKTQIILFPYAVYVSYRICSTSWFPFCQDESSYPWSCCNYVVYIRYMPV